MKKNNIVLAFDLHGVVFTLDLREAVSIVWHWPHKISMILCACNPLLIWYCFALLWQDPTDEEYFYLFQQKCPRLLPLIIKLFNAFKPIPGMPELLEELNNRGYALHIASNIGPRRFKSLQERYPDILRLFESATISNGGIKHLIKKPCLEFFQLCQSACEKNTHIIFIDNNKQNIKAAREFGMTSILFKSPDQLKKNLLNMKIL